MKQLICNANDLFRVNIDVLCQTSNLDLLIIGENSYKDVMCTHQISKQHLLNNSRVFFSRARLP